MAQVVHLRCRHCGEAMKNSPLPYCAPCNLELCYKAMPILLGMLMTGQLGPKIIPARISAKQQNHLSRWKRYPHLRYIMD